MWCTYMMVYTMGFSIHTKIAVFLHVVDGVQWFRFGSEFRISIVWEMRRSLSIIQVVDFLQASTDTLCSVVPFCLYKMGLVLLVFLNPVKAWVISWYQGFGCPVQCITNKFLQLSRSAGTGLKEWIWWMKKVNLASQLSIWLVEWSPTCALQNAMSNFTAENSSSEDNPCLFRMPLRVFFAFSFGRGTSRLIVFHLPSLKLT